MSGAEVVRLADDEIEALAANAAAHLDPDEAGRQVEAYLAEIRSDLSETIREGIVKVIDDTGSFEDWRADRGEVWL
jgi:hypothetical protein